MVVLFNDREAFDAFKRISFDIDPEILKFDDDGQIWVVVDHNDVTLLETRPLEDLAIELLDLNRGQTVVALCS